MKCVLTVAGLGTRLLPVTKELPKEMLPIFDKTKEGNFVVKSVLQKIYETLYDYKIRDFCFVVGQTKRAVETHFIPDSDLVQYLRKEKKKDQAKILDDFFKKLENSNIVFTFQPKPIGFGDAILRGEKFVGNDYFLLHAGDDIVVSRNNEHLKRLEHNFKKYNAEIACLIEEVDNPTQYGVVSGPILEKGVIEITKMVEKPKRPQSKFAIIAIYLFKPIIFHYLSKAKKYSHPEKTLAEAFNIALKNNDKIIGVLLNKREKRLDIGTPESYSKLLTSFK